MSNDMQQSAVHGFGLGLRRDHYSEIEQRGSRADWFEAITENYLDCGGAPRAHLAAVRADFAVVLHGVSLSLGGSDVLDEPYLRALERLIADVEPAWISDHLCWTGCDRINSHDLLPLPYSEEALLHAAARVRAVQDRLGRRILVENVSSYVTFSASTLPEWLFLDELAREADCLLLLDVNNVYVSARNHGFDPYRYIDAITPARVAQIHLAGHSDHGDHVIDTHDAPVCEAVWALYRHTIARCGPVPTMIERDDAIPPLAVLEAELDRARAVAAHAVRERAA